MGEYDPATGLYYYPCAAYRGSFCSLPEMYYDPQTGQWFGQAWYRWDTEELRAEVRYARAAVARALLFDHPRPCGTSNVHPYSHFFGIVRGYQVWISHCDLHFADYYISRIAGSVGAAGTSVLTSMRSLIAVICPPCFTITVVATAVATALIAADLALLGLDSACDHRGVYIDINISPIPGVVPRPVCRLF
jgi:hypothetical protein